MRVLLTGATGFIGSHVARVLIGSGCEVYALLRDGSSTWRIADLFPRLHLVTGDLLVAREVDSCLDKVHADLCIHMAWYTAPGKYLVAQENLSLLTASIHLASKLARLGCKRFIGIGTCFEYDTRRGYLSEESATRPESLYAACKLSLQLILEQLARTTGMEVAWARLFYQYGPCEDERRLVPYTIRSLLQDKQVRVTKGEQIRDYLHVEDVAAAIWAVAQSSLSGPVNIGSGQPVTVRDVVTRIGIALNRTDLILLGALPYNPADPMFICANNHRLCEGTHWLPQYSLEEGLHHTIAWWQKHAEHANG